MTPEEVEVELNKRFKEEMERIHPGVIVLTTARASETFYSYTESPIETPGEELQMAIYEEANDLPKIVVIPRTFAWVSKEKLDIDKWATYLACLVIATLGPIYNRILWRSGWSVELNFDRKMWRIRGRFSAIGGVDFLSNYVFGEPGIVVEKGP